jgi:hypothetical protein
VRLDSHQRIGRRRQTSCPKQKQQLVRSIYQAVDDGLLSHLFFQRKPSANLYACQDQVSCI